MTSEGVLANLVDASTGIGFAYADGFYVPSPVVELSRSVEVHRSTVGVEPVESVCEATNLILGCDQPCFKGGPIYITRQKFRGAEIERMLKSSLQQAGDVESSQSSVG